MKQKHTIHRLKKHKYPGGTSIFFCTLPDCNYKVEVPLALGKETYCWQCGDPFLINEYTLKLSKPHCVNCGKVKVKGADGEHHFVNKKQASKQTLVSVAADTTQNLKDRLQGIVKPLQDSDI